MQDIIQFITANGEQIIAIVGMAIGLAAAIAAVTPTDKDDGVVSRIQNVFDQWFKRKS
jgi:hypothetical protein